MKLLAVGGGSGGHVTPVLAVINALAKLDSSLAVRFVCDASFESQSRGLMNAATVPVEVQTIVAGKLRRYHGETLLTKLLDWKTNLLNLRDISFVAIGFFQSLYILLRSRPDVVFAKGGYVCLPMGIAAAVLRVPLVIHDSDTRPGLTNKVLARFASAIGTGSPLENYGYDPKKSRYVGVPIHASFRPLDAAEKKAARHELGIIDVNAPLVVVTGGGLGSMAINEAMVRSGDSIIEAGIHVFHVVGAQHFDNVEPRLPDHPHYVAVPFIYKDMHQVLGAADLVVSRASATFLQELAGLAKPVIAIPAAHLGDQIKNAAVYGEAGAAKILTDEEIAEGTRLGDVVVELMQDTSQTGAMAQALHAYARPHAAEDMAKMLHKNASGRRTS